MCLRNGGLLQLGMPSTPFQAGLCLWGHGWQLPAPVHPCAGQKGILLYFALCCVYSSLQHMHCYVCCRRQELGFWLMRLAGCPSLSSLQSVVKPSNAAAATIAARAQPQPFLLHSDTRVSQQHGGCYCCVPPRANSTGFASCSPQPPTPGADSLH